MRFKIWSASKAAEEDSDMLLEDEYVTKLHKKGIPVGIVNDDDGEPISVVHMTHINDIYEVFYTFKKVIVNFKRSGFPEFMIYDYYVE